MRPPPDAARHRPLLIEVVGPAGAGKSTVFHGLLSSDLKLEPMPILRKRPYTALLAWNVASAIATIVRLGAVRRRWTARQVLTMAYLQALPRALERPDPANGRAVVFDQGPMYFLTRPSLLDRRLAPWRRRTLDRWTELLDAVVWLDAPDPVLLERINTRGKWHRLKGRRHDDGALELLGDSRAVLERALAGLENGRRSPKVLRFDTSRRSAEQIVDDVLAELAQLPDGSGAHAERVA